MSNIATTIEQSVRLIRNGIDPLTADMYYEEDNHLIVVRDDFDLEVAVKYRHLTPAWSFSKLFDMVTLDSSEFVELNNSNDYIEFLTNRLISEYSSRKKVLNR